MKKSEHQGVREGMAGNDLTAEPFCPSNLVAICMSLAFFLLHPKFAKLYIHLTCCFSFWFGMPCSWTHWGHVPRPPGTPSLCENSASTRALVLCFLCLVAYSFEAGVCFSVCWLLVVFVCRNCLRFEELKVTASLKDNLFGRMIVEHPALHICTAQNHSWLHNRRTLYGCVEGEGIIYRVVQKISSIWITYQVVVYRTIGCRLCPLGQHFFGQIWASKNSVL